MPKVECIIFDVDGTLVDSRKLLVEAHQYAARSQDLPAPTNKQVLAHMGKSVRDISLGLHPDHDPEILVRASTGYVAEHAHDAPVYGDLKTILQSLRKRDIKLAVMTGGNHLVRTTLQKHGIEQEFTSIVHSGRVAHSKPDPEGILLALDECQVAPAHAVMVGDMTHDILAGKNAKLAATIGLTHGFGTKEELAAVQADFIIDDLLAIEGVIDKIEAK